LLNKLKLKSEFSRNVLTLITGTTIAQAIPIAISPILTRLYSPEDFGKYAIFLSIIIILSSVSTLRYEQAIMLPKLKRNALILFKGSLYILLISTLIITMCLILINKLNYFTISTIYIFLIPLAVFITGITNINISYLNRLKDYKTISKTNMITSLFNATLNLSVGYFLSSYFVLSINSIASKLYSLKFFISNTYKVYKMKIKKEEILIQLKKYDDMLKFSAPEVMISAINQQSTILFLTYFFDPILAGGYFLIQRIFGTPISVFSTSFSKVFFKEFTNSKYKYKLLVKIWIKLFVFTLPVGILLYIYMHDIIITVFGSKWAYSADIAHILLPYFIINFIFSATSTSHITLRLQHLSMSFAIISFFIKVFIFSYGNYLQDSLLTIQLLVIYDIIQIILMNFIVYRKLKAGYI